MVSDMRVRFRSITLFALLVLPLMAGAATVYKWTDAEGNVHFSDRPDELPQAEKVDVPVNRVGTTLPRAPAPSDDVAGEAVPQQADAAARREIRDKNCTIARRTLEHNENIDRMYRLDEQGERVFLTDAERDSLLKRSRDDVAEWCD